MTQATWFQLQYQVNPIQLTHGIAVNMPGGAMALLSLTNPELFSNGVLFPAGNVDLDETFAQFMPLPGSSYIDQAVGEYPFANQAVAANAVIQNPLRFSMRMVCPLRPGNGGWPNKNSILGSLFTTLYQHNTSGGTYTVATPGYTYTECLLVSLRDTTNPASKQPQMDFQMDFIQPLLTESQALQSQNNLYNKITVGSQFVNPPAFSGIEPTVSIPPSLAGASGLIPSQGTAAGISASPVQPATPLLPQ